MDSKSPLARARHVFLGIGAVVAIVVGTLLSFWRAWVWSGGAFGGEVLGYALSGVLIAGLIAYAIAGRKSARSPTRFALAYCVVSALVFATEVSSSHPRRNRSASDLVKEAVGTKPVDPGSSTETDRLARNMLRDMLTLRTSHDAQVGKFKGDLSQLYSAESFSDRVSMQRCIDAVQGTLAADEEFSHQFQAWRDHIKEEVDRSSLSEADKEGFIQGVEKTIGGSDILKVRDQIVEAEEKWAAATKDLYTYAMTNQQKIRVKGSELLITDERARSEFNRQLKDCKDLRSNMRSFNSQLRQLQDEGMKKVGVTRDDLGLGQSPSPSQ